MEVMFYFENEFCSMECFIDGNQFYEYLNTNENAIKDFEILNVEL